MSEHCRIFDLFPTEGMGGRGGRVGLAWEGEGRRGEGVCGPLSEERGGGREGGGRLESPFALPHPLLPIREISGGSPPPFHSSLEECEYLPTQAWRHKQRGRQRGKGTVPGTAPRRTGLRPSSFPSLPPSGRGTRDV